MNYELPNILTLGLFDSKKNYPGVSITTPRSVSYYELEYFIEDGGVCVLNGVKYEIKKGGILLAKPGDIRYSHLPFTCRFLHFVVNDKTISELLNNINSFSFVSDRKQTEYFFSKASSLFHSRNTIDNIAASAELLLILHTLSEEYIQNTNIVPQAQKFIESNYHINLSTKDIASECYSSVSYLHRMFKKKLNTTPGDYLASCRISAARNLLINTTLPLTDISFRCGFNSQSYFSYCFKQHTGLSPKDYRKKHRGMI